MKMEFTPRKKVKRISLSSTRRHHEKSKKDSPVKSPVTLCKFASNTQLNIDSQGVFVVPLSNIINPKCLVQIMIVSFTDNQENLMFAQVESVEDDAIIFRSLFNDSTFTGQIPKGKHIYLIKMV